MAANQIYNQSLMRDQFREQQRQSNLALALREAEMNRQAELERAQMDIARDRMAKDEAYRNKALDFEMAKASMPQQKPFSLAEALYSDMKAGNRSPETLKGLGMYVEPTDTSAAATEASGASLAKSYGLVPVGVQEGKTKWGLPSENNEPVALRRDRNKDLVNLADTVTQVSMKKSMLDDAEKALAKIPTGLPGRFSIELMKRFDPNNPILADWQTVKGILTDAQLLNTAKTKGAISDREMELFAEAAANDSIASVPRIKAVLSKMRKLLSADETKTYNTFRSIYGEQALNDALDSVGQQTQQPGQDAGGVMVEWID